MYFKKVMLYFILFFLKFKACACYMQIPIKEVALRRKVKMPTPQFCHSLLIDGPEERELVQKAGHNSVDALCSSYNDYAWRQRALSLTLVHCTYASSWEWVRRTPCGPMREPKVEHNGACAELWLAFCTSSLFHKVELGCEHCYFRQRCNNRWLWSHPSPRAGSSSVPHERYNQIRLCT